MNYRTIEKGYIGQLIVEKKFLNKGWTLYRPILENGKIDLIAEKDNKYIRIQIKTVQTNKNKNIFQYAKYPIIWENIKFIIIQKMKLIILLE